MNAPWRGKNRQRELAIHLTGKIIKKNAAAGSYRGLKQTAGDRLKLSRRAVNQLMGKITKIIRFRLKFPTIVIKRINTRRINIIFFFTYSQKVTKSVFTEN